MDSATSTIGDVTKPLSFYMPPAKICEKLKAKDSQICELKYGTYTSALCTGSDWRC